MRKNKKSFKISTLVFFLTILVIIILASMGLKKEPNIEIINILGDMVKVLVGALAGAIAGENKNE